jgi:hypothetical protein
MRRHGLTDGASLRTVCQICASITCYTATKHVSKRTEDKVEVHILLIIYVITL